MISYTPTDSARAFHESRARVKALWGPIGSGKSSAAFWEFFLMCMESRVPLRGIIVRSSYRELHDTSRKTFMEWFGPLVEWREKHEMAIVSLPGPDGKMLKHEFLFRAIQTPQETSKLLSLEIAFAFLEECVPAFSTSGIMGAGLSKQVLDICKMRLRQKGAPYYRIVCTANPPSKTHWYYTQFIEPEPEVLLKRNTAMFFQPPYENKVNLPDGYYEEMSASLDPELVRRFVEGEILSHYDGQVVFPEARQGIHVLDEHLEPVKGTELILGFDWGNTPATIITQKTPAGQWIWLRELQSFNAGVDAHCEILRDIMKEHYPGFNYRCYGDPSGEAKSQTDAKTCFQVAASKGFVIVGGKQDWQSRKEAIKQRLLRNNFNGTPALVISRYNCPLAADAITGGYRYPVSNDGTVGTRPMKNSFSHLMDAAQYIATREFEILSPRPREDAYLPTQRGYWDPFKSVKRRADGTTWMSK